MDATFLIFKEKMTFFRFIYFKLNFQENFMFPCPLQQFPGPVHDFRINSWVKTQETNKLFDMENLLLL